MIVTLVSCSSESGQSDKMNYNLPETIEESITDTSNLSEAEHVHESETQASIVLGGNEDQSILVNDPKAWSYLSGFQGITSDCETPVPANLGINLKQNFSAWGIVCPDPENDVIYYVNYGKDNYIYQLKGDISTLVVEKKAKDLQLFNNELYFLSDDTDSSDYTIPKGIYKYNLETKELTLVLDARAKSLYVNSNGIYYNKIDVIESESGVKTIHSIGQYLAFDSDTPKGIDTDIFLQYKEYTLVMKGDSIKLHNNITEEEIKVIPIQAMEPMTSIHGDILYFTYELDNRLYSLNLKTGATAIYDLDMFNSLNPDRKDFQISGYTVMNDELFITAGSNILYQVDINTGNTTEIYTIGNNNYTYVLTQLFTSGDRLFAIGEKLVGGKTQYALLELVVTDDSLTGVTAKELNK